MINFSSDNIQLVNRNGYAPVVLEHKPKDKPLTHAEQGASIYDYSKTMKSPVLQYFVSNISENIKTGNDIVSTPVQADGSAKLTIGYINDVHGQYLKLAKIGDALRDCDIRFSGGDNMLGDDRNESVNRCVLKYMDGEDFEASALGNHDVDATEAKFKEITKDLKMKYLAANFNQDSKSKDEANLKDRQAYIHDKLVDSYVAEYKGLKYGVVGVAPVDIKTRLTHTDVYEDFKIDNLEDTIKVIQQQVDELRKQGIKHIFLLSHAGYFKDQEIAKETSGIDVIIGGHSHNYVNGIKSGENLFYSKDKEPVLITNAEKDGNYYGKLNLEFNKDGVLTGAANNLYETSKRHKNLIYKKIFNDIMGNPEVVGEIRSALPCPKNRLIEENPHAHFVADAMRNELDVDISILNAANIRNTFDPGKIDTADTKSISPFENGMVITTISEKDLVDGIKIGAKSVLDKTGKPGLVYASGITYSVSKSTGDLLNMKYTAKDGTVREIDVNNPDPNKIYRVSGDDYVLSGRDGFEPFNQIDHAEQKFNFDKDKLIADYIKHQQKPIDIDAVGRINIID